MNKLPSKSLKCGLLIIILLTTGLFFHKIFEYLSKKLIGVYFPVLPQNSLKNNETTIDNLKRDIADLNDNISRLQSSMVTQQNIFNDTLELRRKFNKKFPYRVM